MEIKKYFIFTFILLWFLGCYIGLNRIYMKGVAGCIQKGYDVSYCEYHASR